MSECPYTAADFEAQADMDTAWRPISALMLYAAALLRSQVDQQAQEIWKCQASVVEHQRHRDRWRGYAYGTAVKPLDFLDGNMVERPMTRQEQQAAEIAELKRNAAQHCWNGAGVCMHCGKRLETMILVESLHELRDEDAVIKGLRAELRDAESALASRPSRADLEQALELARRAGELAPSSGIWAYGASERRWAEARRLAGLGERRDETKGWDV